MVPKVSILIPCYNAEQWIAQAINSALEQTYPNKEVIVVDDGSSDSSLEIIKTFSDLIHWETQPNQGGNVARNRLLELSSGEWLQYLDADDYLLPNKIQNQVTFLSKFPDTDIIWSPGLIEYWDKSQSHLEQGPIHEEYDLWILLAKWNLPQTGRVLWRKQALIDVQGWKPNQPCCQEHELYMRLLMAQKKFRYTSKADSVYRLGSKATVSRKNPLNTIKFRLKIEAQIEQYLERIGKLNQRRQDAINQARFECARIIWNFDRNWAIQVMSNIQRRTPNFSPSRKIVPLTYLILYKLFGFSISEKVAEFKRKFNQEKLN
jgi:glycosyltransferase involved in cell wall biosynthesis